MAHTTIPNPQALARIRYRDLRAVLDKYGLFTHEDVIPFIDPSDGALVITEGNDWDAATEPYCDALTEWVQPELIYVELKWAHRHCHGYGEPQHFFKFELQTGTWHPVNEVEGREIQTRSWEKAQLEYDSVPAPAFDSGSVDKRIEGLREPHGLVEHPSQGGDQPEDSAAARIEALRAQIRLRKPISSFSVATPTVAVSAPPPVFHDPPWNFPRREIVPNVKAVSRIRRRDVDGVHDVYGRFLPEWVTPFIDSYDGALIYTDGCGLKVLDYPYCNTCLVWWLPNVVSMNVSWWSNQGGAGELDGLLFFIFDEGSARWSQLSGQSPLVQELRGIKRADENGNTATPTIRPLNVELDLE